MKWSWRIARIAGIDLYVHVTFLILVGWVALSHYLARQSVADAFTGVAFIFSLFAIVVLHELGHALTARRFGIPTRDITLLPIGGVARLDRMPQDPKQELLVALAGAAGIGQAMAVLFGFVGLFTNPFLVFIALFVWLGAAGEASMVQMRSALAGIPVQKAMVTDFRTLAPNDQLGRAVDYVLAGFQQDFPVVEEGRVVGVLTRSDLLNALARRGKEVRVGEVMQRDIETGGPWDMLEGVLGRLQRRRCHTLPVVQNGQLVGLVT